MNASTRSVADVPADPLHPMTRATTKSSLRGVPQPDTMDPVVRPQLSQARKWILLALFCGAQYIDVFNNSALFAAIPTIRRELNLNEAGATWLISSYQLTFASFLLVAGKVADIYNPKTTFLAGVTSLGLFCLGAGFTTSQIPLLLLRAFAGITAALTIPSALKLLVNVFPKRDEQALAIALFGGTGALANSTGLVIGALFVEFTSWQWVLWFVCILALPIAGLCAWLVPQQDPTRDRVQSSREKLRRLDIPGVTVLTSGLVLFIFSITSGSEEGWGSAMVLAPLIISLALITGFFWYETRTPEEYAAIPPRTWFLPNFSVLFGAALLPIFWWTTQSVIFTTLWQELWGWSALSMAIHSLPLPIFAFGVSFTGGIARRVHPKWLILGGQIALVPATILFTFADRPGRYWSFIFPAFAIGTTGAQLAMTHNNIAIFRTAPPSMAGVVGALFNAALQLGSAVGISASTSIQTSVEASSHNGFEGFSGRRAAFWFLFGIVVLEIVCVSVFYRTEKPVLADQEGEGQDPEKVDVRTDI